VGLVLQEQLPLLINYLAVVRVLLKVSHMVNGQIRLQVLWFINLLVFSGIFTFIIIVL
jgi:hypothetical protein